MIPRDDDLIFNLSQGYGHSAIPYVSKALEKIGELKNKAYVLTFDNIDKIENIDFLFRKQLNIF